MSKNYLLVVVALFLFNLLGLSQDYELKSSTEVFQDLKKLEKGLRVLYVAAHPDDENTRLIAWLENDQHIETAYLSLTRGQGGQNLIGDEKGDGLGVIRTYELLEARKIDGGEQMFTRAVDFGYSKSAEESFEKWGKEEVLGDVVYAIRKFRPHIIITRFPPNRYAGHGHHEASAILAEEAFDLASDPNAYPEQLTLVETWKPQLMYFNTSSWWRKELADKTEEELKEEQTHRVNIGVYNPLTGYSINETAALARSKHRCQAFGTNRDRGIRYEYLKQLKGEWNDQLFGDVVGIWKNSPEHQEAFQKVLEEYSFTDPSANLELVNNWIEPKLAQRSMWAEGADINYVNTLTDNIKQNLMGVRVEVFAGKDPIVVESEYEITVQVYNAQNSEAMVRFTHEVIDTTVLVPAGEQIEWNETLMAPNEPSTPYWLRNDHGSLYNVPFSEKSGLPRVSDEMISYSIRAKGRALGKTEIHRKWRDRSIGEIVQPMQFVPKVFFVKLPKSLVVGGKGEGVVNFTVKVNENCDLKEIRSEAHQWSTMSAINSPSDLKKGQVANCMVKVIKGQFSEPENLVMNVSLKNGEVYNQQITEIKYEHIPNINIVAPAQIKLMPVNLPEVKDFRVLYISGSGDEVPEMLSNIGYSVEVGELGGKTISQLLSYKTIVCGIRSFNKNEDLANNVDLLHEYAMEGGTVIVQYNTSYGLLEEKFSPFELTLSRDRVTEEDSEVKFLNKNHPIFNTPNNITTVDFENWVQERGLYFAGEWSDEFEPLLAWHDKGEEDVKGGLLVSECGKGAFIYTGISFFRQLPAGVSGAYRLFDNMIQYKP